MNKLNVVVLFGGDSPEHEVSKTSAATIISNISEETYNIIPMYITRDGKWLMYDGSIDNIRNVQWERYGTPAIISPDASHRGILRIVGEKARFVSVDVVFPVLHGSNGEDGSVQGLFELAGIPYVGSKVLSSALCMDKALTNQICVSLGIKHTPYIVYKQHELVSASAAFRRIRRLGYPCFVKPACSGSTIGISRAKNKHELDAAIETALMYDNKIIVEKAVSGRELECAVLGSGDNAEASIVGEILPGGEYYDFDSKYNNKASKTIAPADVPEHVSEEIRELSLKIFKALDCHGLARVDFFWDHQADKVVFNEINTMPGFTSISMYPMLWNEMGVSTSELLDRLIKLAMN